MTAAKGERKLAFVVSDSRGALASHALRATLELFAGSSVNERRYTMVHTAKRIHEIVLEVAEVGGFILFTFAKASNREEMRHQCQQHNIPAVDLSGPLIRGLGEWLHVKAASEPQHKDDPDWLHAMEFFHACEDGQHPEKLLEAQVVVIGPSRVKKTPACLHLALRGLLPANVPLVPGVDPPAQLFEVNPGIVFVFTMRQGRLLEYRKHRLAALKAGGESAYVDPRQVAEELRTLDRLCAMHPRWRVVDVTSMGSEEAAGRIIELMRTNGS